MKTSVSFLVRAWDMIWEMEPEKAVKKSPWSADLGDLISYVGDIDIKPDSIAATVELPSSEIVELHRQKHPDWHVFPDFVSLNFEFEWNDSIFISQKRSMVKVGLSKGDATIGAGRRLSYIGNSIAQRLIILGNLSSPSLANNRFCVRQTELGLFEEGDACGSWLDLIYEDSSLHSDQPLRRISLSDSLLWEKMSLAFGRDYLKPM